MANKKATSSKITAIKAGKLVDPLSGEVLSKQTILIEGGRIVEVGSHVAVPKSASVIDLLKYTVLPGLIDCHTHILDEAEIDPLNELRKTAAEKVLRAIPHARRTLEAGFTTVRDVGTYRAFADIALRDAIANGYVVGPRMFVPGAYITISKGGGALTGLAPDITLPLEMTFGQADGPWEVRKRVREIANRGVDLIKLIVTGAVLTHGSNPDAQEFTLEEIEAAVDEARKFGLKVAAHAHGTSGTKNAVEAGVASIEHGTYLDEQTMALMIKRGTYLVPDLYVDEFIQGEGKLRGMPEAFIEHDARGMQVQRRMFSKATKAKVKIAFGTDAGVFPHGENARQFALMTELGMEPMQAIATATTCAADLLNKSAELGSITPGKLADLIAVTGDPIKNIRVLERVDFVMKEGIAFKTPEKG